MITMDTIMITRKVLSPNYPLKNSTMITPMIMLILSISSTIIPINMEMRKVILTQNTNIMIMKMKLVIRKHLGSF